ncbi:MAG: TetR/AcrR family transcriptional regulator [Rubrivivax sp.]|nr:MAG: TetR/AcrR family transcriptional regulator [Rubrivivax sp.]
MTSSPSPPPARATYRHGDLRRALLAAALDMAREGGPGAIGLREVTRRAGVVPNAAYRHFTSLTELLNAVRAEALAAVAHAMEQELAALEPPGARTRPSSAAGVAHARSRLRAIGRGYLKYARSEPGLFRTAFLRPNEPMPVPDGDPAAAGPGGLNPFELLTSALDGLTESGVLPESRRPHAEFFAWSAVHGLALLMIDGPLQAAGHDQAEALGERLLDMVERGL